MKIVAVSDLHGNLPSIPKADLLLVAGDLCPNELDKQESWFISSFLSWLETVPVKHTVFVAGNHDFLAYEHPALIRAISSITKATYLCDTHTVFNGLKIWGSPYTPPFGDWAFQEPEGLLLKRWDAIPHDVDILLMHGPPRGIVDGNFHDERCGSSSIANKLSFGNYPNLKLYVCGHIHDGFGIEEINGVKYVNAAITQADYINDTYVPKLIEPVIIEL